MKRILDHRLLSNPRRTLFGAVVVLAALALLVVPGLASDDPAGEPTTTHNVQPVLAPGNPSLCAGSDAPEGFRINDPSSGTFTDPDNPSFSITLKIPSENPPDPRLHEGPTFDFGASGGVVEDMIVKGGPNANSYDWIAKLGAGVTDDTYLHSPVNPNNQKYYGLSHIDVCYTPTVTKSGTKFHDRNADGDRDTGEEGLSGWKIEVYADNDLQNGVLDAAEFSAGPVGSDTTDGSGNYSIDLQPGFYIVCEVAQSDWFQSAPDNEVCAAGSDLSPGGWAINLTADDPGNDFGNFQQGTKSGRKFEDLQADGFTGNGVDDNSDPALSGWTINAYTDDGDGVLSQAEFDADEADSATTNESGVYELSLDPGDYIVCEVLKSGWTQSYPPSGDADCSVGPSLGPVGYAITVSSQSSETGNDFGNWEPGTKSGTKVEDMDADGDIEEDSGNGLSGWTIEVYADNGDGVLSAAEFGAGTAGSAMTDGDGNYTVSNLDPGDYIACEVLKADWFQSYPTSANGADCTSESTATNLGEWGHAFTITSGLDEVGNDFGNFQQGTKSGTKVEDMDADGEIGEDSANGLSGWTINVYADDGDGVLSAAEFGAGAAGSATTDGDGDYTVSGLNPGDYIACEVLQTDWFQSFPSSGADCTTDSTATDLAKWGHAFTITSGEDEQDNDFGNYQNATKAGFKYKDADNSGDLTVGDTGLNGWTIVIYSDENGDGSLDSGDVKVSEDVTAAHPDTLDAGYYEFSGLTPGQYIVCEVAQADWAQTAPDNEVCNDDPDALGLADGGWAITLTSRQLDLNNHFFNTPLSKFDVRFFDLTGFTNATISCIDADMNSVGSIAVDDESADPELVVSAEELLIGTYTCTIEITDP